MMSVKRLFKLQVLLTILFTIAVIGGIVCAYLVGALRLVDNYVYDRYFKTRGPIDTSQKIVLVMMDQRSALELKRQEAWLREGATKALKNLCQAGAEVIGLDMLFIAPSSNPAVDLELAEAIEQCNNIVLANTSSVYGHGERLFSLPIFQEGMIGDGFIDLVLDKGDEILRQMNYLNVVSLQEQGIEFIPSFSLELVRSYLNIDFIFDFSKPDFTVLGLESGRHILLPRPALLINFPGDHTVYPSISYIDIVNNQFDPEVVKGKVVIIGSALPTEKDLFTTSYTRFQNPTEKYQDKFGSTSPSLGVLTQKEFGVVCHAHIVETILSQRYITKVNDITTVWLICMMGIFGILFYLPRIGMFFEAVALIGGISLLLAAGYYFFITHLLWIETAPLIGVTASQFVVGIVLQKSFDKRKTNQIKSLFGRYVSPSIVDELVKDGIQLEGRNCELSIFFNDLRGFTTISEELGAKDTGLLLNFYFSTMIPIVFKYQGTLDKLMGDAIMAFFGAPVFFPDHSIKAAEAALDMQISLEQMRNSKQIKGIEHLHAGFGINTGIVTVGNLGSHQFMDYTIVGDAVNLTSRLEGLTKYYGVNIILSEFTVQKLDQRFLVREIDQVRVKGKIGAVSLFELMGYESVVHESKKELADMFHSILTVYRNQQWDTAEKQLKQALKIQPNDKVANLYLERIAVWKQYPPGENWDGITTFDHK